jgi:O-antigen biosynthesis protein
LRRISRGEAGSLDGYVDYCGVSGSQLLVSGWFHHPKAPLDAVEIVVGERALELSALTVIRGSRPDVTARYPENPEKSLGFVVAATLVSEVPRASELVLRLRSGRGHARFELGNVPASIDRFIASIHDYAPRDRDAARRLAGNLLKGTADSLSMQLGRIRMNIEAALSIGTNGVYLHGWLVDPERQLTQMKLRVGAQTSEDLLATLARIPRADVTQALGRGEADANAGLVCFVPISRPVETRIADLLLTTARNETITVPVDLVEPPRDTFQLTDTLLSQFDPFRAGSVELLSRHVGPALEAAWNPADRAREARVWQAGTPPRTVVRSVVIPLYGRFDFMLYQVNEFARDPDFRDTEVIYVVDDPRILDEAVALSRTLHAELDLPIQVLDSGKNLGFAGATNLGARHARGRYLVLLNSDVLPRRPGWLSRLQYQLRELPDAGPIAPRLVYHDSTIQHDGIAFRQDPSWPGIWLNDHPGKGLPASIARLPAVERVPAVTAACMLLTRALFDELGGLDEGYIVGDFEDTHLCLEAARRGLASYIVRDETLFHLERQSQSFDALAAWRLRLTLYNAWRHTRIWGDAIASAAAEGPS